MSVKKSLLPLAVFAIGTLTLVSTPVAHADGIVVGDTYTMTVNPYASGETDGSYYVGLTTIHITGNGVDEILNAYCIDPLHDINVPDTYQVIAQGVGSSFDASLGGPSNANLELQSALGLNFGAGTQNDIDAQHAIWNIGGANPQFSTDPNMTNMVANANAYNGNYGGSYAFEEIGGDGQSFMDPSPVPEPSTLAMLGTGLVGLAGAFKRKLRS